MNDQNIPPAAELKQSMNEPTPAHRGHNAHHVHDEGREHWLPKLRPARLTAVALLAGALVTVLVA